MGGSAAGGELPGRRPVFGLTFRTVLTAILLGLVVLTGFGWMTVAVQQLRDASRAEVRSIQSVVKANELERALLDLETGLRGFLLTQRHPFLQPYQQALARYPQLGGQLLALTAHAPVQHARAARIMAGITEYARSWAQPLIRAADAGDVAAAVRATVTGGGKRRVDRLRGEFQTFTTAETRITAALARNADAVGSLAFGLGIGAMAVSALGVALYSAAISRTVVAPLRRLAVGTARLAARDLSVRVPAGGSAEVGELNRGFNAMAASLEEGRDALEEQQGRLAQALSSVRNEKTRSELLREFGDQLAEASGVDAVSDVALRGMAELGRAELGALYLHDADHEFLLTARRGTAGPARGSAVVPGQGLAGRAAAERAPVHASFSRAELSTAGIGGSYRAMRELHLPLQLGERTVGVVSLGRAGYQPFTDTEVTVLEQLASQAAVACAEALSRRQVERAVQELAAVLGSTDEGIYAIGRDGAITLVNEAALEQTGYARQELLGRHPHEMLHHTRADGSHYPLGECPICQVLRTGIGRRISDEVFWRRDGGPFPVEYSSYPLYQDGEIAGVVVTFMDITSRKRAEAQRDTQHAVTRVIAAAQPGDEEFWDRAMAAACTGLALPIGFGWAAVQHGARLRRTARYAVPGFAEAAARLGADELAAGEGAAGLALTRREPVLLRDLARDQPRPGMPPDPRLRSAVAIPAMGVTGRVLAVAEFFGDRDLAEEGLIGTLTSLAGQIAQYIERMRAEARTQRVRNDFVATVSHELRTPLTSITGWLHILQGEEPGPLTDEQRRFLATIKRNSDRLLRQVGDLLMAGKLDSGELSFTRAEVDVAELVREVADLVSAQAAAKRITLTVDAGHPAVVVGDRERLVQLLDNLAVNAIKFTPEGGRVGISVSRADGRCRVAVSDTGIGIPPQDRPHLFQRFFRASSATAQGITGTGLGLAICKAIAEGHQGTIYLADAGGPGSVFVVELPLAAPEEAAL